MELTRQINKYTYMQYSLHTLMISRHWVRVNGFFQPSLSPRQALALALILTEWLCTTVMTVRRDGWTRRHMSVLGSSNVHSKLPLRVNKEDRKWQFGSANQECHTQLRPLPTRHVAWPRRSQRQLRLIAAFFRDTLSPRRAGDATYTTPRSREETD